MDKIVKIIILSVIWLSFLFVPFSYLFYFFGLFSSFLGYIFFWIPGPYYDQLHLGLSMITGFGIVYLIYLLIVD